MTELARSLASGNAHNITRLTVIKSLCKEPVVAQSFALYILRRMFPDPATVSPGSDVREVRRALARLNALTPGEELADRADLLRIFDQVRDFQNEHKPGQFGAVRLIKSNRLLLIEFALRTFLEAPEAGFWAYHLAARYAGRYDSRFGEGLIPASASYVRDIAAFWAGGPTLTQRVEENPSPKRKKPTAKQGRYLSYIHYYTKLHGCSPAMSDLQNYFRTDPPTVHQMVLRLEKLGFLGRIPFQARSLRVLLPPSEIPPL